MRWHHISKSKMKKKTFKWAVTVRRVNLFSCKPLDGRCIVIIIIIFWKYVSLDVKLIFQFDIRLFLYVKELYYV